MTSETLEKEKNDLIVPIAKPLEQFDKHLDIPENNRILFSAPFGTGKTTFLKEFFKGKEDKYQVFHLYPVNYQVANNKDIFELLKFDILTELIPSIDFTTPEYNLKDKILASQYYLMNDGANLALDILKGIPKLGKAVSSFESIIKFCSNLNSSFKQPENEMFATLEEYSRNFQSCKGSIYEMDSLSHFISEEIHKLNDENKGKKETVLIIDDLDRVDPNHIFRLLNVFSAHFDQQQFESIELDNKFGFSKIILVCDLYNIEKIFINKFGNNVDFKGYIDKFRSVEIFYFNNIYNWHNHLKELTQKFIAMNSFCANCNEHFTKFIDLIIYDLLQNGLLNIRQLLKLYNFPISLSESLRVKSDCYYRIEEKSIGWSYKVLLFLYDGNNEMLFNSLKMMKSLAETRFASRLDEFHLVELIEVLGYRNNFSRMDGNYSIMVDNLEFKYEIKDQKVIIGKKELSLFRKEVNRYALCIQGFSIMDELI